MAPKKILLIGMLDSIHVGRWISQFEGAGYSFVLFPSKKFRRIHPVIKRQLGSQSGTGVKLYATWIPKFLFGYLDFALNVLPLKVNLNIRARRLITLIDRNEFDIIHALEIQGAGYLLSEALNGIAKPDAKVVVTNYGSDIYYFSIFPEHESKIRATLAIADYYSAECNRDYILARDLGFSGKELPCIPNAGGFEISQTQAVRASARRQIIVKCYGGQFGRGELIIQALHKILPLFPSYQVLLYSVTRDLLDQAQSLSSKFPNRIRIILQKRPIPNSQLTEEFSRSRVYAGASISDGISTSFLEALVQGAFPIQTDTSCANEWLEKGASGFICGPGSQEIEGRLLLTLQSDSLVDEAQIANRALALEYLDSNLLSSVARSFYERS